jgi:polyisoprenoid-binding protein YceI
MKRFLLTIVAASALPLTAQAIEFNQVQGDKSTLNFTYSQMGVSMNGKFKKFSSQLSFDPAKPAAAKTTIDVDLNSVDAGSSEADDEIVGKQWFNVKAFPTARFESSSFKALGGNRYEVSGKLTIKGKTQAVVAPLTYTAQGNNATFDGSFTIRRGDFSIGEGPWAAFDIVANDILIKFRFQATGK